MNSSRPVDEWVSRLSLPDVEARAEALEAVGEALGSEDVVMRERTAQFLIKDLTRPASTAPGLILSLLQADWWPPPARLAASAVQAITEALTRMEAADPAVGDAALVLGNLCRVDPSQLPALAAALDHEHPAVRHAMARAASRVSDEKGLLLPKLIAHLDDPDERVSFAALEAVGALAPVAPDVTSAALLAQARKTEGMRRYVALSSLRALLDQCRQKDLPLPALGGLEPLLLGMLTDPNSAARVEGVSLLGLTGPVSPAGLTALGGLLKDVNPSVAASAAVALLRLGAPPQEALALLERLLRSEDTPEVQGAALSALEAVEPALIVKAKEMLKTVAHDAKGPVKAALGELLSELG
ncbi:HEAT repeat domain-containing protein [Corallococcus sp. BB11-1]|uniref:HEAT repeat domain-containing protein n=1 Tax=Corallococcus sp. BB11-1 TaxID=2996783 RepID=UPI00226FE986|nr:HEAT repeat domain-containing protein [Corallococcus sp. BB11-1]MCY1031021.1 HEAT repeat domain-containing protein [Corallococcus sp. BB11-1]